jgi:hypothetical protein
MAGRLLRSRFDLFFLFDRAVEPASALRYLGVVDNWGFVIALANKDGYGDSTCPDERRRGQRPGRRAVPTGVPAVAGGASGSVLGRKTS